MSVSIDHFMYAVPSLDEGMAWAEQTFGVAPAYGGEHVGMGTCNALLSLGDSYLEIIAPDPAQQLAGTLGERFSQLSEGGMVTWAARGELVKVAESLNQHGQKCIGPNTTQRQTAEGELLVWELLFPRGSAYGGRMPFFIDWLECAHPRSTNPQGGVFRSMTISTPDAQALERTLADLGLSVEVVSGEPDLTIVIDTAAGEVALSQTLQTRVISMA